MDTAMAISLHAPVVSFSGYDQLNRVARLPGIRIDYTSTSSLASAASNLVCDSYPPFIAKTPSKEALSLNNISRSYRLQITHLGAAAKPPA